MVPCKLWWLGLQTFLLAVFCSTEIQIFNDFNCAICEIRKYLASSHSKQPTTTTLFQAPVIWRAVTGY